MVVPISHQCCERQPVYEEKKLQQKTKAIILSSLDTRQMKLKEEGRDDDRNRHQHERGRKRMTTTFLSKNFMMMLMKLMVFVAGDSVLKAREMKGKEIFCQERRILVDEEEGAIFLSLSLKKTFKALDVFIFFFRLEILDLRGMYYLPILLRLPFNPFSSEFFEIQNYTQDKHLEDDSSLISSSS